MASKVQVAKTICTFMGVASKQQCNKSAKLVKKELSKVLSGLAKGEKEQILESLSNMASGRGNFQEQVGNIKKVALNARQRTGRLVEVGYEDEIKKMVPEQLERMKKAQKEMAVFDSLLGNNPVEQEITLADAEKAVRDFYSTMPKRYARQGGVNVPYQPIVNQMSSRKIVTDLSANLRKELQSISLSAPDITLTPEQINKISKDVTKEVRQDMFVLGTRGFMWPITKLASLLGTSKSFRKEFGDLAKLSRDKFGMSYYQRLLDLKKLAGRAPEKIVVLDKSASATVETLMAGSKTCQGGFNQMFNTIEFTKELQTLSRAQQASLIAHELKHFEQSDIIIRTFGIDRYIQAIKNRAVNSLVAQNKGKTREEIVKMVENDFNSNNYAQVVKDAFKGSVNAQKIDINSVEAKLAKTYIEALENYVQPDDKGLFLSIPKEYFKNALEDEAYKVGRKNGWKLWLLEQLNLTQV